MAEFGSLLGQLFGGVGQAITAAVESLGEALGNLFRGISIKF